MSINIAYESDRGCILVAAALMDKLLEDTIRKHIKKFAVSKTLEKNIFDLSGPISNFSAKIAICRSFGLIDDLAYNDLMILRKLRNSFAHATEEASFLSEEVKQKVRSMHFVQHCVREIEITRYKYEGDEKEENAGPKKMLKEWEALSNGFLNYDKAMFCFAVSELEYHIEHYAVLRRPPQKTMAQRLKKAQPSD